jgi:hypothetical protein
VGLVLFCHRYPNNVNFCSKMDGRLSFRFTMTKFARRNLRYSFPFAKKGGRFDMFWFDLFDKSNFMKEVRTADASAAHLRKPTSSRNSHLASRAFVCDYREAIHSWP